MSLCSHLPRWPAPSPRPPAGRVSEQQQQQQTASGGVYVKRLATAGCDGAVRVYRSGSGGGGDGWVLEATLRGGHKDWVRDVAWCPASGGAAGGNVLASTSDDGSVVVWRQGAPGGEWAAEALPPFPAPVWRASWSVTGNLLAISCGDNSVTLWRESLGGQWQQISTVPDPTLPMPPRVAGY